jgi:hypothetical protein
MPEERKENLFYAWAFPGCPVRVHLRLEAIAEANMSAEQQVRSGHR